LTSNWLLESNKVPPNILSFLVLLPSPIRDRNNHAQQQHI